MWVALKRHKIQTLTHHLHFAWKRHCIIIAADVLLNYSISILLLYKSVLSCCIKAKIHSFNNYKDFIINCLALFRYYTINLSIYLFLYIYTIFSFASIYSELYSSRYDREFIFTEKNKKPNKGIIVTENKPIPSLQPPPHPRSFLPH